MSFNLGRTILDGFKNTFVNIPLNALDAEGILSSTAVLYGDGLWKQPILVAPVSPSFDNSAQSAASGVLPSGSPLSWQSGESTGAALGIVELNCGATSGTTMTLAADAVVTWGGVEMTSKGNVYNDNNATYGWTWVFELDNIPDGDSEIVVTLTQAGKNFVGYGSSYSYTDVAATGALVTAYGTGTPALTVPAENTNDILWGSLYTGGNIQSAPSGFTARETQAAVLYFTSGDKTGVSSATFGATASAVGWSAVGFDLIAAENPLAAPLVGGVEPVAVQTANYTASARQLVPCNAASGAFTVTLPTAPADGENVVIKKIDSSTHAVTYACGGSDVLNVASGATSGTLILQWQAVRLQYCAATAIWYVISTDAPLGQLDSRYEPLEQFAILPAAYTLTSTTSLQQLFNTTTSGALTLPVGDYFFECEFSLSGMSATSGYYGFGFAGTAVITQSWAAVATKSASTAAGASYIAWGNANAAVLIPANTSTTGVATIRGSIKVTTAGTIIPSVNLSVAAAAVVAAGAIFRITSVNSSASYAGAWS